MLYLPRKQCIKRSFSSEYYFDSKDINTDVVFTEKAMYKTFIFFRILALIHNISILMYLPRQTRTKRLFSSKYDFDSKDIYTNIVFTETAMKKTLIFFQILHWFKRYQYWCCIYWDSNVWNVSFFQNTSFDSKDIYTNVVFTETAMYNTFVFYRILLWFKIYQYWCCIYWDNNEENVHFLQNTSFFQKISILMLYWDNNE